MGGAAARVNAAGSVNVGAGTAAGGVSSFARNILSLMERTEYRRCESGEDLEDAYRLRYRAYHSNDMIPDCASGMIRDDLDEQPNAFTFGIYVDGQMVSTLRLHHVSAAHPECPSTSAFGDIVRPMIAAGRTFIDPSRFAADPAWARDYPQIPYITLRLAIMGSEHFEVDDCLITIREDHALFYKRTFSAEMLSEARPYPGVFNRVQLFRSSLAVNLKRTLERFPFFRSTPMEQRMMFAKPDLGMPAPLTILPTAKYMKDAA
jgi:hypothetical protein